MPTADPRLGGPKDDPRVLRAVSRRIADQGEMVLKAARPVRRRLPSTAEIEHERSLWGKHDSPLVSLIEEDLYALGFRFLRDFIAAVLGKDKPPAFAKAEGWKPPKPPGWGEVMKLFEAPGHPEAKMATWESLLDGFVRGFLPGKTIQDQAAMWALRSNLLHVIGERVKAVTVPGAWDLYFHTLPPAGKASLEWSKVHGAQFITKMADLARQKALDALVESQMAGGNHHDLARTLLERLGTLNRDWRRIAITETAMAVSSGQLSTVADSGEWEAVWVAGPKACAFCLGQNGRVFRIVPSNYPNKNDDIHVYPGKTNVGRSVSLYRKDGTKRTKEELWVPTIPSHPNCACVWAIRRRLVTTAGKSAAAKLAEIRAARFKSAVG